MIRKLFHFNSYLPKYRGKSIPPYCDEQNIEVINVLSQDHKSPCVPKTINPSGENHTSEAICCDCCVAM